jgi:toxin ParE1/3/4
VSTSRIVLSDLAVADILEQAEWYESRSDKNLAKRWEEVVTSALLRVCELPETGALCAFNANELRGTRRVLVLGFSKHLIFYQVREGEILVLRVVHGARDLESLFSGQE